MSFSSTWTHKLFLVLQDKSRRGNIRPVAENHENTPVEKISLKDFSEALHLKVRFRGKAEVLARNSRRLLHRGKKLKRADLKLCEKNE